MINLLRQVINKLSLVCLLTGTSLLYISKACAYNNESEITSFSAVILVNGKAKDNTAIRGSAGRSFVWAAKYLSEYLEEKGIPTKILAVDGMTLEQIHEKTTNIAKSLHGTPLVFIQDHGSQYGQSLNDVTLQGDSVKAVLSPFGTTAIIIDLGCNVDIDGAASEQARATQQTTIANTGVTLCGNTGIFVNATYFGPLSKPIIMQGTDLQGKSLGYTNAYNRVGNQINIPNVLSKILPETMIVNGKSLVN